jgi:hypothetical protein
MLRFGICGFVMIAAALFVSSAAAQRNPRCDVTDGRTFCDIDGVLRERVPAPAGRSGERTILQQGPAAPQSGSPPDAIFEDAIGPVQRPGGLKKAKAPHTSAVRNGELRSSGVFAGPHNYPPQEFAAYGIVAFPQNGTSATRARHIMVCEAFVATLPAPSDLAVPTNEQMVTVWPVRQDALAAELSAIVSSADRLRGCDRAVDNYHLSTALTALRQAGPHVRTWSGRGPFLLAWSPAVSKGQPGVTVLASDLSDAVTAEALRARFQEWRDEIEQNPELFGKRWTRERLVLAIREWADRWGGIIITTGDK